MTRKEVITLCLMDACQGEPHPLMGLLDYLIVECKINPDRLVDIAERHFALPRPAAWGCLYDLHPTAIQ